VLFRSRETAQDTTYRCQLGRAEVYVGTVTQTVREVTGGRRQYSCTVVYTSLVTHTQGAARDLGPDTVVLVDVVVAFLFQLRLVHLGGRCNPEAGFQLVFVLLQHLAVCTDVPNDR